MNKSNKSVTIDIDDASLDICLEYVDIIKLKLLAYDEHGQFCESESEITPNQLLKIIVDLQSIYDSSNSNI